MNNRTALRPGALVCLSILALAGCQAQVNDPGLNLPISVPTTTPTTGTPTTGTPTTGTPSTPVDTLGYLDVADATGLAGWALSKTEGTQSLQVEFFVDGDSQTGTPMGQVAADQSRPDVNAAIGVAGDHGFQTSVASQFQDGKPHLLYAYAVGPFGLVELGNSPKSFTIDLPPCSTAGPLVDHDPDEYVINLQAANGKYVCAECGGDDVGLVNANRDAAGEWEMFYVRPLGNGNVSIRSSHDRFVSAELGGGTDVHANRHALGPWETFQLIGNLSEGSSISLKTTDGTHYVTANINQDPDVVNAIVTAIGAWEQFKVHVIYSPVKIRPGIVRAQGRNFVDDQGQFYPLGATLMWALWGWKFDQDRLKQNLQYLKSHGYDYVRILGEVDWSGETIDWQWPDYQQVLGDFMDYAYDQCGLRTEITIIGGNDNVDYLGFTQKIAAVTNAGRQHKVLDFETANESYGRPITLAQMNSMGRWLKQNTPNLVALSSSEGLGTYKSGFAWPQDYISVLVPSDAANLGTTHMDRSFGDDGWRAVRQPWDFKDLPFPVSHNEPIGPRSSVAEEVDPLRLTMLRAVGIINGVTAFVLHNGAGVAGQVDPAHNRPANLWEVPGIDAIMDAVRGLDLLLPPGAGDGQHWNNAWAGNPWVADAFWENGHGVNRNYTASTPDGWISTEAGVKQYVILTASRHSRVEIIDALKGKVDEVELQAGQTYRLTPVTTDNFGDGGFIIIGHYL
jgi:hypothetical protein